MLKTGDSTALSSLIKSTPLQNATSIELLQVNQSIFETDGTLLHAVFGDNILSHIAVGGDTGQGTSSNEDVVDRAHLNAPSIQIL